MEKSRKLEEIERARSSGQDNPIGMPGRASAEYVMPQPRFPLVMFRYSGSDEPVYAVILRRGDRTLDLGVFAPNNRTISQKDGCRHVTDPDLARLAEHVEGVWEEPEEFARLSDQIDRIEQRLKDCYEVCFDTELEPQPDEAE